MGLSRRSPCRRWPCRPPASVRAADRSRPFEGVSIMSVHRIAPIALLVACAPATAWGQACPTNDRRGINSDVPMLPTVVSYAVTKVTGPANERERESHDVTVIGGDATEGDFRIDMRLSAE